MTDSSSSPANSNKQRIATSMSAVVSYSSVDLNGDHRPRLGLTASGTYQLPPEALSSVRMRRSALQTIEAALAIVDGIENGPSGTARSPEKRSGHQE
jgi:hypothetical protein